MDLSIVLITWNSERYVSKCIESVFSASSGLEYELILVDNGSIDDTLNILESFGISDIVKLSENKGVAYARNIGMQKAKGRFVLLLDIDTEINRDALLSMIRYSESNYSCGICACKLYNSRYEIQDSCRKIPVFRDKFFNVLLSVLSKMHINCLYRKVSAMNEGQFYHAAMAGDNAFEVEYVIGACQLIKREVISDVGYLDDNIFYGPEDADYCLRARLAGWKIVYLPYVSFMHDYQQMTNKRLFSKMSFIHLKSLIYFFIKHKRF